MAYAVGETAPLESQAQADDARKKGKLAFNVKLLKLVLEGSVCVGPWRNVEQEEDEDQNDGAQRKVDVEAPSPSDVGGEGTADQRAKHRRNAVDGSEEALVYRPFFQGNSVDNEGELGCCGQQG